MVNIIITGGSSSIGRELINKLSLKKVNIIYQINKSKPFIKKKNINFIRSDFCNHVSLKKFINFVTKKTNKIDFLIHLPSSKIQIKKFEDYSWFEINSQINIQVRSLHFLLTSLIKKKMLSRKTKIIILGSEATSGRPPRGMLDYVASKGLLKWYCNIFRREFKDIKLTLLSPNMFKSPLLSNLPEFFIEKNSKKNSYKSQIVKKILSILK
jgi:short-subunit dehydrogenase